MKRQKIQIHVNGTVLSRKQKASKWFYIYVLIKDELPIYAGIASNIYNRVHRHRTDGKVFDRYIVINQVQTREEARTAEHTAILLLKAVFPQINVNKYVAAKSIFA